MIDEREEIGLMDENVFGVEEPSLEEQRRIQQEEIERMARETGRELAETPIASTAVAVAEKKTSRGFQNIEAGDISFPRISMDGQDGVFRERGSGIEMDELTIIPLFFSKSRVRFRVDSGPGSDPASLPDGVLCRSGDSLTPSEWLPELYSTYGLRGPAATCDACGFSQWGEDKQPPSCRMSLNFLAIRPDDPTPFVIGFHGTSTSEVRRILTILAQSGGDIWSKTLKLGVEKREKDTRRFYTLRLIDAVPTEPETQELCERLYEDFIESDLHGITMIIGGARSGGAGSGEDLSPIT